MPTLPSALTEKPFSQVWRSDLTHLPYLFFITSAFFSVADTIPARLDFALTNVGSATLAALGELAVAGLFVQVVAMALPHAWGGQQALQPSPGERSL